MPRKPEGPREQPVEKTKEPQKKKEMPKEMLEGYLPKVKAAEAAARVNDNSVLVGELQGCIRSINMTLGSIESLGALDKTLNFKQLLARLDAALAHDPKVKLKKQDIRY